MEEADQIQLYLWSKTIPLLTVIERVFCTCTNVKAKVSYGINYYPMNEPYLIVRWSCTAKTTNQLCPGSMLNHRFTPNATNTDKYKK
jgi:hypothetical protein